MVRGRLILICQSGGDFVTNNDGTLTYNGGDANAVNINQETMFDDLKLKLAEMCNFEVNSVSMKYFLPANRRHLITLKNDKDLKRMVEFHMNSVTVDIFVSGKQGFDHGALKIDACRVSGVAQAETVRHFDSAKARNSAGVDAKIHMAGSRNYRPGKDQAHVSAPADSSVAIDTNAESFSPATTSSAPSDHGENHDKDYSPSFAVPSDATIHSPTCFDDGGTPADTVKKRRRTASWTIGANGPTIVGVADKAVDKRLQKKDDRSFSDIPVGDYQEEDSINLETPSGYAICYEDWSEAELESWKHGIVGIGQEFKSVKEFREALQKYAIAHLFKFKLNNNDAMCASGTCVSEGCSWLIDASYVSASQSFKIKKFNSSHTCKGDSWKIADSAENWLVNVIRVKLQETPNKKPKDISKEILQDFGIKLSYTLLCRGIEDVKEQLQGSYEKSYNQLPFLCEQFVEKNPGSMAKFITDDDKRFQCLYVSFHAAVHGFRNSCRPLLFLESTPLKSEYQEILLTANALDADDGFLPIAFAIVDAENENNWRWFLDQLKGSVSGSLDITFVSDREKCLRNILLEVFENAYYGFSIFYLLESFKRNLKGPFSGDRGLLPGLFLEAAHAPRLSGFKNFTEKIRQITSQGYDLVIQIEPEYWTSLLFQGEHYNYITADVAESYLRLMDDTRNQTIIHKIEALLFMMSEMMSTRHKKASTWSSRLTPSKEKKLHEETFKAFGLKVLCSSDILFEVHDDCTHVVNLETRECTCLKWKEIGLPCRHAIAVFSCKGISPYDCCSKYYTTEKYRSTYAEHINPLPCIGKLMEREENNPGTVLVLPPGNPKLTAEQKKELNKIGNWNKRTVTCTRCKEPGHNKASCKAIL